jgi:hypothetical protein
MEVSDHRHAPAAVHLPKNIPYSIGGKVDPRVDLDVMDNRTFSFLCTDSNPDSFVVKLVVYSL